MKRVFILACALLCVSACFGQITGTNNGAGIAVNGLGVPTVAAVCDDSTDDTTVIQAALNNRGTVVLPAGKTCKITACLSAPSYTTFDGNGSVLHQIDMSGCIIKNASSEASAVSTPTVTTTSGSTSVTVTSGSVTAADVGRLLTLNGGWSSRISAVSGSTITIKDAAPSSGTGVTSSIYAVDKNITIKNFAKLRKDGVGLAGTAGSGGYTYAHGREETPTSHDVKIWHADNVVIRDLVADFQRGNYGFAVADVENFYFDNIYFPFNPSAPIQLDSGPIRGAYIGNYRAYTVDDCFAITSHDWSESNPYFWGNVYDVIVENLRCANVTTSTDYGYQGNLVRIEGSPNALIRNVTIKDAKTIPGGNVWLGCVNLNDSIRYGAADISGVTISGMNDAVCTGGDANYGTPNRGAFQFTATNIGTVSLINVGTRTTYPTTPSGTYTTINGGGASPAGSSGDLQTNNGSGGLGSVAQSTFVKNQTGVRPTCDSTARGYFWTVQGNGTSTADATTQCQLNADGTYSWNAIGSSSGSMVYPGAGIGVSTGSAWGTSLTAPTGTIVGTTDTQTLTNKTIDTATPTEVSYLSGVTSAIQTQLNAKVAYSTAAQPTCDSTHRGWVYVIQGAAGVADTFQVCLKNSSDAYAWVTK